MRVVCDTKRCLGNVNFDFREKRKCNEFSYLIAISRIHKTAILVKIKIYYISLSFFAKRLALNHHQNFIDSGESFYTRY